MKCFLISDNIDTQMGLRLAGVEGVVVHERDEVLSTLAEAAADKEIAVVLMTKKLTDLCRKEILDIKLNTKTPLIVEIPDRHGESHITDTINGYVSEAIGLKL